MNNPAAALVPWVLFCVMLALGVGLPSHAWREWRQHRNVLLRVELASCVLVPLLAFSLLSLPLAQQLSSDARHAIALMGACPSAPLILRKAERQGGDASLAALLQISAALMAIVTVPLLAQLAQLVFGVEGWNVLPRQVALQVAQMQVLPVMLGLALRRWSPQLAQRLEAPLKQLANLLLLLLLVVVLIKTAPLLARYAAGNSRALLVMALLVLGSLGLGLAMGSQNLEHRTTTALVTSMRNPGLALLLATSHAPQMGGIKLGILSYVLLTVLLSAPLLRLQQMRLQQMRMQQSR